MGYGKDDKNERHYYHHKKYSDDASDMAFDFSNSTILKMEEHGIFYFNKKNFKLLLLLQIFCNAFGRSATMLSYLIVTVSAVVHPLKPVMAHRNLLKPELKPVTVKLDFVLSKIVPLP